MNWIRGRAGRQDEGWIDPAQLAAVTMQPIGVVRSSLRSPAARVKAGQRAMIELLPELAEAVVGLAGFSHAFVLTWLDRVSDQERAYRSEYPAGDRRLPKTGVLALRTHHRPNPLGLTVVAIERVDGATLYVVGLDVIDGTPVLDIKPYVAYYDSVADARLPAWAGGEGAGGAST